MSTIREQQYEQVEVARLEPHPRNPRRGDVPSIAGSIEKNGFYGAILAQRSTGRILAGNHRYLAAVEQGLETVPVLWVDVDDDAALRILLADNRTSDLATYADDVLAEVLRDLGGSLEGTGYGAGDLEDLLASLEPAGGDPRDQKYVVCTDAPIYEPKGEKPAVADLFDTSETDAIVARIEASSASEDVKAFLRAAAQRHTSIRFDRAAEFYAHADPEVQRLFEDQALVVVDFESAIERGWARFTQQMEDIYEEEDADGSEDPLAA